MKVMYVKRKEGKVWSGKQRERSSKIGDMVIG